MACLSVFRDSRMDNTINGISLELRQIIAENTGVYLRLA
jgi:hypothetical protein